MKRRYNTRSSSNLNSKNEENTEHLPSDLIVELLLKSPVKSIAKFRCVSKQYDSTIRGPVFTESFFTISSSRPSILFSCLKDGETFFFSSPQPQNPSLLTANYHMSFSINCFREMSRPVHGFVCGLNQRTSKGRTVTMPLICNPSTGQSLTLPRVRTRKKGVISYLGYDPVGKQFKILSMTQPYSGILCSGEHQVLTLETGKKLKWRMIKCDLPHSPNVVDYWDYQYIYDAICINGVFYYQAWLSEFSRREIVCFDIRSEKFDTIKGPPDPGMGDYGKIYLKSILVNYKGGVAKLQPNIVSNICVGIQLWVLNDAQKHEWSRFNYVLPSPWEDIIATTKLCFVGTTSRGEIVMSPDDISDSFYLLYYNSETGTLTKCEIQGLQDFKSHKASIFLDHVENVKLMSNV